MQVTVEIQLHLQNNYIAVQKGRMNSIHIQGRNVNGYKNTMKYQDFFFFLKKRAAFTLEAEILHDTNAVRKGGNFSYTP